METTLFWTAFVLISYVYLGYPALVWVVSRWRPRPVRVVEMFPTITFIIPAYNEERWIRRKIENTLELDYPRSRMQILLASDGSTDGTVKIAREYEVLGIEVVPFPQRLGKQEMLNRLAPQATGEILVMSDANALLDPQAVRQLVRNFADPEVGCVTGRRLCILQQESTASIGESLYWRYESWIKRSESALHSCLGAYGQLYAVRKSVFPHVEKVGEDLFIPMKVIAATGLRVIYDPDAIAYTPAAAKLSIELERKARAHVSFLITLGLLKELLIPWRTRIWWQFVSHHLLRMFVPFAMIALFLASSALAGTSAFYLRALMLQGVFYGLAFMGFLLALVGLKTKLFYVPFYFVFANLAVVLAWVRWPLRQYDSAWQRTERLPVSG